MTDLTFSPKYDRRGPHLVVVAANVHGEQRGVGEAAEP
jgi:hypothetical protein